MLRIVFSLQAGDSGGDLAEVPASGAKIMLATSRIPRVVGSRTGFVTNRNTCLLKMQARRDDRD